MSVNGVRMVVTAQQENSQRITVMHFRTNANHTWTQNELLALATNFWAAVGTSWRAMTHTGVNFYSVTATDLSDPVTGQQAVYNIPQPAPGTVGGDALPANVACVVSWKTPFANRKFRGRTFAYGMTEAHATGSTMLAGYLALLGNWALAVLGFNNSAGVIGGMGVYSRAANVITFLTAFLIDSIGDSQRNRLPGRGN